MNKHLTSMIDLTKEDILDLIQLGEDLKFKRKNNIPHKYLEGKTLGMIFEKASTRTRVSFETGIFQLGGVGEFLSSNDLQIGRGEPIKDTARVLSRYLDIIMIRTFKDEVVKELAQYSSVPVINALTDNEHPCQVLADLMTIKEYKGQLQGLKVAFIGDGNNMVNSYLIGCSIMGMDISIASPEGYKPNDFYVEKAKEYAKATGSKIEISNSPIAATKDADVVVTDVWASMGQESEAAERIKAFKGFQVNMELLSYAKKDAMVLHCLPAHREEEITDEVLEAHANEIFDEAENRLHIQKAIMLKLVEVNY